jgi:hypothetical protein
MAKTKVGVIIGRFQVPQLTLDKDAVDRAPEGSNEWTDVMHTVYENGQLKHLTTLERVRALANARRSEYHDSV